MAHKSPKYTDCQDRYRKGQTIREIANQYGVSFQAVWVALKTRGEKLRPTGRARKETKE
jgi:predicted DNA-binding protein YlxM (UPF0122 family)